MINIDNFEIWFLTGSQNLYGQETLDKVADHSRQIAEALDINKNILTKVVYKPVLKDASNILQVCREANQDQHCIGVIAWMHTFSPAKMWIAGLKALQKPLLHLHTQFNQEIPWHDIDMDFMNLNQSAHGGREFGFINSRLRLNRKVVVGHWQDGDVHEQIDVWARAACAWHDMQAAKFARIGDNMREVAVTEGDKVEAQAKLGYSVNGYGLGDLVKVINEVDDKEIDHLVQQYFNNYAVAPVLQKNGDRHDALREAAKIELGLKAFLQEGGFAGFTDTFENLHGLNQLPGIAVQRLMAQGYGFGAEGDWKTAALVRAMKVMAIGKNGGTSFMEDYTYHLRPGAQKVLGAHMLEICESIADAKPTCEIHSLSIGGKSDPVRLVFNAAPGAAINASIIDMGNRFRLLVNNVISEKIAEDLPKLPVARALWTPQPSLSIGAAAWIYAGGAHHTGYSTAIGRQHLEDFAEMADIELVVIDDKTELYQFKQQLRWNEQYYATRY